MIVILHYHNNFKQMNISSDKQPRHLRHFFKKEERLCSKKLIAKLFAEGNSFLVHPIKIVYLSSDFRHSTPLKVAFAVSKREFKRSVDRNYIKRRMREAYRLNRHQLQLPVGGHQFAAVFIYIGKELPKYSVIDRSMKRIIHRFSSLSVATDD